MMKGTVSCSNGVWGSPLSIQVWMRMGCSASLVILTLASFVCWSKMTRVTLSEMAADARLGSRVSKGRVKSEVRSRAILERMVLMGVWAGVFMRRGLYL